MTVGDVLGTGDKVAMRSTIRAAHDGEVFGIPGTGQPIQFMAIDTHHLQDGEIVKTWHIEDFLSMLFQIDASIQPGSTAGVAPTACPDSLRVLPHGLSNRWLYVMRRRSALCTG